MAHNFKLTGDYYVSVDGSDSNNGLTKDTPKRTVQAGINLMTTNTKTLIIGAGVYKETVSTSIGTNTHIIKADGEVIIEALNTTNSFFNFSGFTVSFYNITFRNFLRSDSPGTSAINPYGATYYNCKFINCGVIVNSSAANTTTFNDCILINVTSNNYTSSTVLFTRCILINTQFYFTSNWYVNQFKDCYIGKNSIVTINGGVLASSFNYNNFDSGAVILSSSNSVVTTNTLVQDVNGFYYNPSIASGGTGTISDPYGRGSTAYKGFYLTAHKVLYSYNANSFSSDPLFNDIQSYDFTLQATSPHIGRASDLISNIGGTKYAVRYSAKGDAFNTSAVSVTALNFVGNDYTITSPNTSGEVVSAPILVSAAAKVLQKITYNGLLEFNKLISGGTAGNRNVPDQDVYAAGTQGANPDRLVYYMRYSTQTSQPTADAQWDNGGYWTAGNYGVFEWNTKPSIDNAFVGNGDPTFNAAATPTYLQATWIQLKVKLRNNYA